MTALGCMVDLKISLDKIGKGRLAEIVIAIYCYTDKHADIFFVISGLAYAGFCRSSDQFKGIVNGSFAVFK